MHDDTRSKKNENNEKKKHIIAYNRMCQHNQLQDEAYNYD